MNTGPTANTAIIHADRGLSNIHNTYVLGQANQSLLMLTNNSNSSTWGKDHFEQQNWQRNTQTCKKKKKSGTELTTKRTLAYNRRAETRRQSIVLFDFGWERAHGGTQIFHCCMRVHKWWQNRPVLTLELQINSSKQERRQTQNVRRTRINCVGTNLTASSMRTKIFSSAAPFWSIIYTL